MVQKQAISLQIVAPRQDVGAAREVNLTAVYDHSSLRGDWILATFTNHGAAVNNMENGLRSVRSKHENKFRCSLEDW